MTFYKIYIFIVNTLDNLQPLSYNFGLISDTAFDKMSC